MAALPIVETPVNDNPYDGDTEAAKLTEPITVDKANMFAWYDADFPDENGDGYPDSRDAYSMPHHYASDDGQVGEASLQGVRSAMSGLDSHPDVPASKRQSVRDHLQAHLDTWDAKGSSGDMADDGDGDEASGDAEASETPAADEAERVDEGTWDGASSNYSDSEYESACALDRSACGAEWKDKPPKERCSLPYKTPSGVVSRAGVHAAASRISQVTEACPTAISEAKAKLRAAYKSLGEDPPDSIGGGSEKPTGESAKAEDFDGWSVTRGEARHGTEAIRMSTDTGSWAMRAAQTDDSIGVMTGHFAVFDRWTEINNYVEGNFMERMAPGAFTKTFQENRQGIRVLLNHGRDPSVGMKPLGPIRELGQDAQGASYEVDLLDTSYNRDILPGLKAGQYGASFRFQVLREEVNPRPGRSEHNPDGIEERTIVEARVREFGPVTFPAYADATAGIRSGNAEVFDLSLGLSGLPPEEAAKFLTHLREAADDESETREAAPSEDAPEGSVDEQREGESLPPPTKREPLVTDGMVIKKPAVPLFTADRSTRHPSAARITNPHRPLLEEPEWKL